MADEYRSTAPGRIGEQLHTLSSVFAIVGGVVLVLMTMLVVTSILGRAILSRPVPGDFEIVGIGTAVSVFLFLPYCFLQRGNVAVDIFISKTPRKVQCLMDLLAAVLFGTISAILAWRMIFGLADTFHYADMSMILGVPLWWAYPVGVASFALLAVSCFYMALVEYWRLHHD